MPDLVCKINKDEITYQGRNPFVKPKMVQVSGKTHASLLFFLSDSGGPAGESSCIRGNPATQESPRALFYSFVNKDLVARRFMTA